MINLEGPTFKLEEIDTVLFDKDGTFIDLHYFWGKMTELRAKKVVKIYSLAPNFFEDICKILGYDTSTKKMLNDGITALYSRVKIIEIFCEEIKKLGINAIQTDITELFDQVNQDFYTEMHKYTKPINTAIEFIKQLKNNNIKTGIVTSDSVESTIKTIKHFKWNELFDVIIGRESTSSIKESGEGVNLALQKLNSTCQNTVMIGDAPMDYQAAINAGVEKTILVATGQIDSKCLKQFSNLVVEDLSQITIY